MPLEAIQVIDSTFLIPLPEGETVMVGAPPEALKVLNLWEFPAPTVLVLPPDPLFADGINQASFEFLLYNHLFIRGGLRDRRPFQIVCDAAQAPRVEALVREMLRGPSASEMAALRTPAAHRRQLLRECAVVSGEVAILRIEQLARVIPFNGKSVRLGGGVQLTAVGTDGIRIAAGGESVVVPRRAQGRTALPLFFADVEQPVAGPRFGLQIIGSASGFTASEWSSCFVVWINGLPLLIDGTPYMDEHLSRLGIEDDQIVGYLITHNHEDHANLVGQLVSRRRVTVLTSPPVMAGLTTRLSAILDVPGEEIRRLVQWVPLEPGLEGYGPPLPWFGAEIRTWYSVHTIPTLGVDIRWRGRCIRLPGDTLWGRQLEPLLEREVISKARYDFIQHTYDDADVIVADAGGGPIHPDPQEVKELIHHRPGSRLLVTHVPEAYRNALPAAEPGTVISLAERPERSGEEAMGLFGSPLLDGLPERWLLALLYGGEVEHPAEEPQPPGEGGLIVLAGSMSLRDGCNERIPLQRGDVFHPSLLPDLGVRKPLLAATARWTRVLRVPDLLFQQFVDETETAEFLHRLYRTRGWWRSLTNEELGLDALVRLARLCREREFAEGQEIVRQGERADRFYVVTSGEVEVERKNGGGVRRLGRFGAGYHFGEIALLGKERRIATIRALSPVQALELPAGAFRQHLMNIPVARYHILTQAARRRTEVFGPD